MPDQIQPNATKAGALAQKIVAILAGEDSETRRRAIHAATALLGETVSSVATSPFNLPGAPTADREQADLAAFFSREENLDPSECAQLCAAYLFSLYGRAALSQAELRALANEAGVVLPDRLDMTLKQARWKGKKLFQVAGRGLFRPTAAAGLMFKERWGVKPGRRARDATTLKEQETSNAQD